jgi:RNA polymerase sigma-70 factor (ECF subfamily)
MFRAQYAGLVAFATRYVGERATAEELVQSLFADLWESRENWPITTNARAYLYGAIRNRALNARKRGQVEQDWDTVSERADTDAMQTTPARPDEELEASETHERLERAFGRLPERCRLTMQLRWRDQLSYAEIAETLGISVKGVENQLSRGLKALRELLS